MSASKGKSLVETVPHSTRMSYRIGRGEQGVLSFEPYKSDILPLWRFRTVPIAQKSASALWDKFETFYRQGDFVGMDMTRKFIQMGYTRAKRYANHAGGRKYKYKRDTEEEEEGGGEKEEGAQEGEGDERETEGTRRQELPKSKAHKGKEEKEAASKVFKEVWDRCRAHEGYQKLKKEFLEVQKSWVKESCDG